VTTGDVISGAFDSLLAKLIVTGSNRADALERARRALDEFEVTGLPTVLPFHRAVIEDPAFTATSAKKFAVHTTWIETEFSGTLEPWSGSIPEQLEDVEPYRTVVVEVEGRRLKVGVPSGIFSGDSSRRLVKPPRRKNVGQLDSKSSSGVLLAPMQATVVKITAAVGDRVVTGDVVCVLEAMKMEQPIKALRDGVVEAIHVQVGESVSGGTPLARID
jgi:acetyl-CoA/propionyl-CoA carboxylase biotin carboxyl carrier protein